MDMVLDQAMDLRNGLVRLCYNKDYVSVLLKFQIKEFPRKQLSTEKLTFCLIVPRLFVKKQSLGHSFGLSVLP